MRAKTMYGSKPDEVEILKGDNGSAVVCLRENIEQTEGAEGEVNYCADEYTLTMPNSSTLGERIKENFDTYLAQAKDADYNTVATAVREKRRLLLEATDNYCLVDRQPSAEIIQYRQELRDITEQEGFPYDVVFPVMPE